MRRTNAEVEWWSLKDAAKTALTRMGADSLLRRESF